MGLAYEAEASYIESHMLANPSETVLDDNGYPIDEETKMNHS